MSSIKVQFEDDPHTLPALLQAQLLDQFPNEIEFVGYKQLHPMEPKSELTLTVKNNKSVTALQILQSCMDKMSTFVTVPLEFVSR